MTGNEYLCGQRGAKDCVSVQKVAIFVLTKIKMVIYAIKVICPVILTNTLWKPVSTTNENK